MASSVGCSYRFNADVKAEEGSELEDGTAAG
jgi:hypothetical protein